MHTYYDKNYGADYDGNRGVGKWFAEIDTDDDDTIIEQIQNAYEEFGYLPKTIVVTLMDRADNDYEFEIECSDYVLRSDYPDKEE